MSTTRNVRASIRQLDRGAIDALLARNHVGSLAIAFHDSVTIALANYVYAEGHIYVRFANGPDLTTVRHHPWVAFQVSEIAGTYDWRTVTAHGSLELLSDDESVGDAAEFRKGVRLLRDVVPTVFTARDPVPERVHLFRIHIDNLSAHEARST